MWLKKHEATRPHNSTPTDPLKLDHIVRGVVEPIGDVISEKMGRLNNRTVLWRNCPTKTDAPTLAIP